MIKEIIKELIEKEKELTQLTIKMFELKPKKFENITLKDIKEQEEINIMKAHFLQTKINETQDGKELLELYNIAKLNLLKLDMSLWMYKRNLRELVN